jgi:hypothetical protein
VNPSRNTVENCLEAIRNRADLFILVVGGRYGSMNEAGKSITNLEYLEATALKIPKYVFVKTDILSLLPIWHANPAADFSSTVDTSKLLEFVSQLKNTGEVWVFPFNNAQDIMSTLRKQLSYLFANCLALRAKLQPIDFATLQLGSESLRLFIEKPAGWEYLVFAKSLEEHVQAYEGKKLDAELGISLGSAITFPDEHSLIDWIIAKFAQIRMLTEQLGIMCNSGFEKAVGKPNEPGDIKRIIHVTSRIADCYAQILEWQLEFHRIKTESRFQKLMKLVSNFSTPVLNDIEVFSKELYPRIQRAIENHSSGEVVNLTLTLTAPNDEEFNQELLRLGQLGT